MASDSSDSILLKEALMCEKAAPEVLPFKHALVERITTHLTQLESQIQNLENDPAYELMRTLYQCEEGRVKYMLRSYYRVRLMKIEKYVMIILDDDALLEKLSEPERGFAEEYLIAMGAHLKETVLNHMPDSFDSLVYQSSASARKDMVPQPNLNSHCFCRVNQDLGHIDLDADGETVELQKDDLFVVRYQPIRHLLETEQIQLV